MAHCYLHLSPLSPFPTPTLYSPTRVVRTQDLENKMREMLSKIYFDKTKDVLNGLRQLNPVDASRQRQLADELNARMAKKASASLAAD